MSLQSVKEHLSIWGKENEIKEFPESSATVQQAADVLGVEPKRIAKTLSFRVNNDCVLIVAAGDTKIDNKKFKTTFGAKAKMLTSEEVVEETGHIVGGVCPFGLKKDLAVYLDNSLKRFTTVFPACGSSNSAIEVSIEEMEKFSGFVNWVDVCKDWNETTS